MPNTLAYVVLFAWPLVVAILFRRLPVPTALVWSILGGYLVLPPQTGINLPVLPALDKTTVPSFAAAIMCLLHKDPKRRRMAVQERARPDMRKTVWACFALLFGGIILTGLTNSEGLFIGRYLPGLRLYDIGSMALNAIVMLLPFVLARRFLGTREAQIAILRALVLAGLAYSLLILIEVRLSPQLNRWLYGFYAHSFAQQIRFGGFRPTVFIEHGLRVALFVAMSLLAAAVLWRLKLSLMEKPVSSPSRRIKGSLPGPWGSFALWLFVVLILCKSVGAIAITIALLPILFFLSPRVQILIAASLAAIVLLFPMLRGADLVPIDPLVGWATAVDPGRAGSLQFRFDNEDILLDRANEKPLAGWGGFGRNRVFDPETGRDLSVTDGTWIIFMGSYGWLGYLARFGLLTLPLLLLARRAGRADPATAGLALVLAANLVDLIPNSGLTPLTWLIAGALSARVRQEATETAPSPKKRRRQGSARIDATAAPVPSSHRGRLTWGGGRT